MTTSSYNHNDTHAYFHPASDQVSIGSATIKAGESTVLSLQANVTNLGAADIDVAFDSAALNATCEPNRADFDSNICNVTDGKVQMNIVSASGVSGEVTLADITFEAVGQEDVTDVDGQITIDSGGAADNQVSIGSATIKAGESTVLSLQANVTNLGAADIDVEFDSSVLNATCEPNRADFDSNICNVTDGKVQMNIVSASGVSGEVTLADITFEAVGQDNLHLQCKC